MTPQQQPPMGQPPIMLRSLRYALISFLLCAVIVAGLVTPFRSMVLGNRLASMLMMSAPILIGMPFGFAVGVMARKHNLTLFPAMGAVFRVVTFRKALKPGQASSER